MSKQETGFYSVDRCKSGLRAAQALATCKGRRRYGQEMVVYWSAQLALAEKREGGANV